MAAGMVQMPPVLTNAIGNASINCNPNLNPPILQSNLGMDLKPSLGLTNMMLHGMHASLEHDIPPIMPSITQPPNTVHSSNNGFPKQEFDINPNNNGLSMGIPMNMSIPSMFDPLPQQINNTPVTKRESTKPSKIEEPDPTLNMMEKKLTPPEQKQSQSFNYKPKQEQNIKNASSWSSLAQASSPQNSSAGGSNSRQQAMVSFKAFQKQAKEKAEKEKLRRENLELKRQQKEQAEKERLRLENEKRREREEEELLEKTRYLF